MKSNKQKKMKWDIFISHAWEDKEEIAKPLAKLLSKHGLKVWLDENELKLGDAITLKINQALTESRYGLVILSKHFFQKDWPQRELNALSQIESKERKVILPIWHDVDRNYIANYSPLLADKLAAKTSSGLKQVVIEILKVFDIQFQKYDPKDIFLKKIVSFIFQNIFKIKFERLIITLVQIMFILPFIGLIYFIMLNAIKKDTIPSSMKPETELRASQLNNLTEDKVEKMLKSNRYYCKGYDSTSIWRNESWSNPEVNGANNKFKSYNDALIDSLTGLAWQISGSNYTMNYMQVKAYIDDLNKKKFGSIDNWRLPTLDEAMSLMDRDKNLLHIDKSFDQKQRWIWTSDKKNHNEAWVVFFHNGTCYPINIKWDIIFVRAVYKINTKS